jgi:hypothetical protein
MNISLTEEQKSALYPVIQPVYMISALLNDYYSWPKEQEPHQHRD